MELGFIPGYQEAVERETILRDSAFLSLTSEICGVEVRQMTLRDFIILDVTKSPFFTGGIPSPVDVIRFLWVLRPDGVTLNQRQFAKRHRKLSYEDCCDGIVEFIKDTFQDGGARKESNGAKAYMSFSASVIDLFASEYGWKENEVLDLPLKRIFQYLRCITARHVSDPVFFNPSDKVLSDYTAEMNLQN